MKSLLESLLTGLVDAQVAPQVTLETGLQLLVFAHVKCKQFTVGALEALVELLLALDYLLLEHLGIDGYCEVGEGVVVVVGVHTEIFCSSSETVFMRLFSFFWVFCSSLWFFLSSSPPTAGAEFNSMACCAEIC